ncbi:hypothetical protein [uncultured Catenibacterium sp.]|mgnify:CR=1 FL=1|uniref:hypothetical protein n=1 Tax=uncultured Catenibacterium sp. TaxID=286142 RepID=UPI0025F1C97F|nr:hypothetical protein [uncultured Catenibacterium sp.]
MEHVSDKKLEAVAKFMAEYEDFDYLCVKFNNSLKRDRVDVPCDIGECDGDCPFYSKENFLNWIRKPSKKLSIKEAKRPKAVDFIEYIDNEDKPVVHWIDYAEALENYCTMLENLFANLEYDLDSAECENKALIEKLSKIRDVLDEGY